MLLLALGRQSTSTPLGGCLFRRCSHHSVVSGPSAAIDHLIHRHTRSNKRCFNSRLVPDLRQPSHILRLTTLAHSASHLSTRPPTSFTIVSKSALIHFTACSRPSTTSAPPAIQFATLPPYRPHCLPLPSLPSLPSPLPLPLPPRRLSSLLRWTVPGS